MPNPKSDALKFFPKKYTKKDLQKGIFESKNTKEKNLASKIDAILYK